MKEMKHLSFWVAFLWKTMIVCVVVRIPRELLRYAVDQEERRAKVRRRWETKLETHGLLMPEVQRERYLLFSFAFFFALISFSLESFSSTVF